ncbi:MAG TPA: hypothetical protein VF337_12200 [Candidatus Limnocylindrales bacterium]
MRQGGGFRFLAALFFIGFMGLFTLGAFGVGVAVGAGSNGTAFAGWGPGWGHGSVIGLMLTILVFLVLLRMIGFAIFGHHHRAWARHAYFPGGYVDDRFGPGGFGPGGFGPGGFGPGGSGRDPGFGPGGWHRSEWREAGQTYFDEFHRRAHGTEAPSQDAAPPSDQPK